MLDLKRVLAAAPKAHEQGEYADLYTVWGERIKDAWLAEGATGEGAPILAEHPHPQFARERFEILNGWWDYAFDASEHAKEAWRTAAMPSRRDGRVLVPFTPETLLSGVREQLRATSLLWYERTYEAPELGEGERLLLHFEAVDYACSVYCNGQLLGHHVGGYLPFEFDMTDALSADGANAISLCVYDPTDEGTQLRGKQRFEAGGIWYTGQSGIWQTVWTEVVPADRMRWAQIDACAETGAVSVLAQVEGAASRELRVRVLDGGACVAEGAAVRAEGAETVEVRVRVVNPHLWSPADPHLYDLELVYGDDRVASYCAFRTLSMEADEKGVQRFCLNHEPLFLRGVLDQGYWSDGMLTAPSDEALIFDIETMKKHGFNMLRKHIKVESDRWYYHCDRLGMLVWQDMVTGGGAYGAWHTSYKPTLFRASWGRKRDDVPGRFADLSAGDEAYRREWLQTCEGAVRYLKNHPCIVTWVLFNEGWGQFEAKKATELVRSLDATRPIDSVSGWYDQRCGDFLSVHNYFRDMEVYPDKGCDHKRAFVVSEFGGITYMVEGHSALEEVYGYENFTDLAEWRAAFAKHIKTIDALEPQGLAGWVYTQVSDVEEEVNGLLTYDRRVCKLQDELAASGEEGTLR